MDAACLLLRVTTRLLLLSEEVHGGDPAAVAQLEAVAGILAAKER